MKKNIESLLQSYLIDLNPSDFLSDNNGGLLVFETIKKMFSNQEFFFVHTENDSIRFSRSGIEGIYVSTFVKYNKSTESFNFKNYIGDSEKTWSYQLRTTSSEIPQMTLIFDVIIFEKLLINSLIANMFISLTQDTKNPALIEIEKEMIKPLFVKTNKVDAMLRNIFNLKKSVDNSHL